MGAGGAGDRGRGGRRDGKSMCRGQWREEGREGQVQRAVEVREVTRGGRDENG